jgi:hypothetical protein
MSVPLWLIRDATNPDPSELIKYPIDADRNIEPAWPWVNPKSCSIKGINGAKMKRLINVRKKRDVKKRMLQITVVKGSGVGQALSGMGFPSSHGVFRPNFLHCLHAEKGLRSLELSMYKNSMH